MRVEELAGRVILVRAAPHAFHARVFQMMVKDWHLARNIFQLMTALLSICLPRRHGERKRHPGARDTNGGT